MVSRESAVLLPTADSRADKGLRLLLDVSRGLDRVKLRMTFSTRVSRVVRSPSATGGSRCVSRSDYESIFFPASYQFFFPMLQC